MRYSAALAALCLLTACQGDPAQPSDAARSLVAAGNLTLKIVVRGRGEVKHTADLSGATSCSTLSPNPESAECVRNFAAGAEIVLQPQAAAGMTFYGWGGACSSAGTGPCTLKANENRTLEVVFKAPVVAPSSYTLKFAVRGRGEVKHTADLSGATSCSTLSPNPESAECVRNFAAGAEIVLQPQAAAGMKFYGWGGACSSAGTGPCTLKANENRTLEVVFKAPVVAPSSYTLKFAVRGRGEVKHTADLSGATSCSTLSPNPESAECVRNFAAGAEIVLQPQAAAGMRFYGWGGACSASGIGPCTLKANENRTLEVKFGG